MSKVNTMTRFMIWRVDILQEEIENEMKRLKQELKQTMEMYNSAYNESMTAKQKVRISLHLYHLFVLFLSRPTREVLMLAMVPGERD